METIPQNNPIDQITSQVDTPPAASPPATSNTNQDPANTVIFDVADMTPVATDDRSSVDVHTEEATPSRSAWTKVSADLPCPVCWGTDTKCLVRADAAACRVSKRGHCEKRVGRDGVTYHCYLLPPEEIRRFFTTLFEPDDIVLIRPTESWSEQSSVGKKPTKRSGVVQNMTSHLCVWQHTSSRDGTAALLEGTAKERANVFFGVCPRWRSSQWGESWDSAFQIRVVLVLWADIDYCTVEEAIKRCEVAVLPLPTVVVSSGNGVHLYWKLDEAYRIDDVGDPPALQFPPYRENFRDRPYIIDPETGAQVFENFPISPKGQHIQNLLAKISRLIKGDHTIDLARLLRVPGTMNRKDERNGREPVPCRMIECHPTRRYNISVFEGLADTHAEAEAKAKTPSNTSRSQVSPPDRDRGETSNDTTGVSHGSTMSSYSGSGISRLSDEHILERARKAKTGARFRSLFGGDTSNHGGDHSRADLALCSMLVFWTRDPEQIDRLFRQSGLNRSKWIERDNYRKGTIQKALRNCTKCVQDQDDNLPRLTRAELLESIEALDESPTSVKRIVKAAPAQADTSTTADQSRCSAPDGKEAAQ